MKRSTPTILALVLTIAVSSTAFAGNIAGGRTTGNIPGGRAAGNIAGGRAAGHIAGGRSTAAMIPSISDPELTKTSTYRLGMSEAFAGLIRMLLESGALL